MGYILIISMMKACKCLARGCGVFCSHAMKSIRKTVGLANMEVVRSLVMCSLAIFLVYHHHGR